MPDYLHMRSSRIHESGIIRRRSRPGSGEITGRISSGGVVALPREVSRVKVVRGKLWLTDNPSPEDVILTAGESSDVRGSVVIEALAETTYTVCTSE